MADFEEFLRAELWQAYLAARLGKRNTIDEHRFELHDVANLQNLRDCFLNRSYHPSRGVAFIIRDPVVREIVAAPFRDRVVHHFLFNICGDWWDRRFIPDSYSCRKGKGTLYGQKRLAHHLRQVTENYTKEAFVAKLDIQGYFMSLKHQKLYQRVQWGLRQQFFHATRADRENGIRCAPQHRLRLYNLLCYLWKEIIFDKPMQGIAIRGKRSDWKQLPRSKSLFCQPPEQGIVIGNLTSQLLSNIFLDQLDRFVTFDLGYRHYGRYVDDFYILVPLEQRDQLLRDVDEIERFLKGRLGLTLHPKKRYSQLASHGIPFIGATVHPGYILPSRRAQNKAFLAAYRLATEGEGDPAGILSRMGCLKHINSRRLFKRIFDSFGWEYDWVLDLPEVPEIPEKLGTGGPSESGLEEKPLESPPDAPQRQMPLFALPEAQPKKPKTRSQPSRGHQRPVWKQMALIPQKQKKTQETGSREATEQKAENQQ